MARIFISVYYTCFLISLVIGKYVLAWKRGNAILTAGSTRVSPDERIRLVEGYNLEIRDVQTTDAGDYICHIATLQPKEITHTLEVLGKVFLFLYDYIFPCSFFFFVLFVSFIRVTISDCCFSRSLLRSFIFEPENTIFS